MPKVIDNPVNAILNAGKEVLRSSNGSPFGMEEIAQKCSISVPSIYLRFHSFGELMGEVLALLFEEEMEGMQKEGLPASLSTKTTLFSSSKSPPSIRSCPHISEPS